MKTLLLIPARGGSKGIPSKNLALVGGIPLVGRSARTAREAATRLGPETRVICSTDSVDIATVAQEWGAEAPFLRPAALSDDSASTLDVVRHALQATGSDFDAVIVLQPTSPFTRASDVLSAFELFRNTGGPVVSVCRDVHPAEWQLRLDADGRVLRSQTAETIGRRQDAEPVYRPNGAVYVASHEQICAREGFWSLRTYGYVMPQERSIDIDIPADLQAAVALASAYQPASLAIGTRRVGAGHPCFIIAEAGVNHNGSVSLAKELIDVAADAGADAVKFQTFRAESVVSPSAPKAAYQLAATGSDESQLAMVKRLELPFEAFAELSEYCRKVGILFLSTPFDSDSVDFLDSLNVAAFKVPSGEVTNPQYLSYVAGKRRPVLMSTGMATLTEVNNAVSVLRRGGASEIALLQCVSNYPAAPSDVNLRAMQTMRQAFSVPVGYSDHTEGLEVAIAAAALGAAMLEKHFTLDRSLPGPDHQMSLDPRELKRLIAGVRIAEVALGDGIKRPADAEQDTARAARRSLAAARDIMKGAELTEEMIIALRPGTGLSPVMLPSVLGRRTRRQVQAGEILSLEMLH